jgi:sugar phosphate isomerase/epimerase
MELSQPQPRQPRLAVCSWSLAPTSPRDLADQVRACGLSAVQLALDPIRRGEWSESETREELSHAGIVIVSGMMAPAGEDYTTLDTIRETGGLRPDATWPANLRAAKENAAIAQHLGLSLVTLHAGCITDGDGEPSHTALLARLREVCACFAERGVRIAFETGQESAQAMIEIVEDLHDLRVGINFDPGNVILYGQGDPIEAMSALAPWILQTHMKDAKASSVPGEWGEEVEAGTGEVNWSEFFRLLRTTLPAIDVVIEREAGERRVRDVRAAAEVARRIDGRQA